MKITKVSITNYRGLRNCCIPLAPFVCIVGENNAGKSSVLLALSLFFSGTKLPPSEYYDPKKSIRVEVCFSEITDADLKRVADEHRQRIVGLINNNKVTLVRLFEPDGSSEMKYLATVPKDNRFDLERVSNLLRGLRGGAIAETISSEFPEYKQRFYGVTTQAKAKEVVSQIVQELPPDELCEKDQSLPTGIPNSIKSLLPEPILIPAVKDVTDEIKTKESATFGKLVAIMMRDVQEAPELQTVVDSFRKLQGLMNRVKLDDGTIEDGRLAQVREIETLIGSYLRESFPMARLELEIPPPELKQVFTNARLLVDDGIKDSVETKGDGLKRSVTFALLRSYAHKRRSRLEEETNDQPVVSNQPYLFLFEEPELYLHPAAQKVLFDALGEIALEHQVVVTTHSPMFFSPKNIGTFVKLSKKYPTDGSRPYSESLYIDLLNDMSKRDAFQIICFENNSAAFFAKRVLLVEGDSDMCYLKHLAKVLNKDWDFDLKNIPVIRIYGKGNVKRYRQFFENFDVAVSFILDQDILIKDFDKLDVPPEIRLIRDELLNCIDQTAVTSEVHAAFNGEKVREITNKYTWRERYSKLKQYAAEVCAGNKLKPEQIEELDLLFSDETVMVRQQILDQQLDSIEGIKERLLAALRQRNIFVLSKGTIEDYYPDGVGGEDKPTKALNACKLVTNREMALSLWPRVTQDGVELTELEAILSRVFA